MFCMSIYVSYMSVAILAQAILSHGYPLLAVLAWGGCGLGWSTIAAILSRGCAANLTVLVPPCVAACTVHCFLTMLPTLITIVPTGVWLCCIIFSMPGKRSYVSAVPGCLTPQQLRRQARDRAFLPQPRRRCSRKPHDVLLPGWTFQLETNVVTLRLSLMSNRRSATLAVSLSKPIHP